MKPDYFLCLRTSQVMLWIPWVQLEQDCCIVSVEKGTMHFYRKQVKLQNCHNNIYNEYVYHVICSYPQHAYMYTELI